MNLKESYFARGVADVYVEAQVGWMASGLGFLCLTP